MSSKNNSTVDKLIKESFFLSQLTEVLKRSGCNQLKKTLDSFQDSKLPLSELKDTISQQLIFDYDRCRAYFDELNMQHAACSYIRAFNLSGQCKWLREIKSGELTILGPHNEHQQKCVKRKTFAKLSEQFGQNQSENQIEETIENIFERCYNDFEPLWHPVTY